ncbi:hypothetical protein ACQ5SB_00030 [Stenotrophomonas geniculata]|uniref:hypothetical protein n=1 Tax=Stenotrophomonas TaxID=40323 RepID=UPI0013100087
MALIGALTAVLAIYLAILALPIRSGAKRQIGRLLTFGAWAVALWQLAWNTALDAVAPKVMTALASDTTALNQVLGILGSTRAESGLVWFCLGAAVLASLRVTDHAFLREIVTNVKGPIGVETGDEPDDKPGK